MDVSGRDSQNYLMSMEEICDADNALVNMFEKAQLQYALPSSKDHPKHSNKNDVQPQKLYTEDEICEIQEKEANKWKNYIKEKDNIINILKSRESLLKFVLYVLNKQLENQNTRVKHLEEINFEFTPSADEEDMETVEVKKHYQKIHEEEPLEKEMSNSVDEESDVSDKMQILRREIESFQNVIVSKNEQIQQLQSMLDTNEERMNELKSTLKQLQIKIADKDEELEAQMANNQIFPTNVPVVLRKEEEQCACWPLPKTVQETDQEDSIHWVIGKNVSLTKEEELYWPLPKTVQETDRKDTIHWVTAIKEICYYIPCAKQDKWRNVYRRLMHVCK